MIIFIKSEGKSYFLNAREMAPLKSDENMYKNLTGVSTSGPLAIGAKYFFFSSRSLKTRERYISFAQFVYFLREVLMFTFQFLNDKIHNHGFF